MSYWTFVRKNALRNKRRTALTVLSVGFSLFLLITLQTVLGALMNPPETSASAKRLIVRHAVSLGQPMPESYQRDLEDVPHVEHVIAMQWFGGQYKDPKNFFTNYAVGHESFFEIFSDFELSDGAQEAFMDERMAALVHVDLMEQFGWSIGDRITLTGTVYPVNLEFHLIGSYDSETDAPTLYFRHDYLQESGVDYGQVGTFWLLADSADSVQGIINHVDAMFENTPAATKTESAKAFQLNFIAMLGNVQLLIGSISMVVTFTMLLVAGSTMAMTIRERLREVAILKAIGYPRGVILGLVLGEASMVSFLGAVVGVGLSQALAASDIGALTGGFITSINPDASMIALALVLGGLLGVLAGLFPAMQASRMGINEAMRRLE